MSVNIEEDITHEDLLRMTVDVVSAYVSGNLLSTGQIPEAIQIVFASLISLSGGTTDAAVETQKPFVSIRKSIHPDHIICLEDGKKLKMLKRHLRTAYSMSPDEYRTRWGLASDYPMVAPNYAIQRSEFAKKNGLGLKKG